MTGTKMHIEVTEEDIKAGVPCDLRLCPIARAAMRAGARNPIVTVRAIVEIGSRGRTWSMPREAIRWRQQFDAKEKVEAFVFDARLGKPKE